MPALRLADVGHGAASAHALMETRMRARKQPRERGLEWLKPLQVLDVKGDWAEETPDVRPGGWAFQYSNDHYPDLDDTAVVVMAMDRARTARRVTRRPSRAARNGWKGCKAGMAAGAPSTPTTAIII